MDITQLSEQLFNSEPMPPHSIQVEFDGFDVEKLFKALCLIFSDGLRKFYGDDNGPMTLSKQLAEGQEPDLLMLKTTVAQFSNKELLRLLSVRNFNKKYIYNY